MMSSQIKYIRADLLNSKNIASWFTLRNPDLIHSVNTIPGLNLGLNTNEKVSKVLENRKLLLKDIGIQESKIAFANQVHETDIRYVTDGGTYDKTDGFVTDVAGLALAIQVADCAAVLLGDDKNRIIGAAHAGWRGAAANIIPKTIKEMQNIGADIKNIKSFISPCISCENFEIGEEVAAQFPEEFVVREGYVKPHLNLKEFIRHQMVEMGMMFSNIELDRSCTINGNEFYSYRRQKENSGRMMGIITIKQK